MAQYAKGIRMSVGIVLSICALGAGWYKFHETYATAAYVNDKDKDCLEKVAGNRKSVPLNHGWICSARRVGTNLGD